MSYPVTRIGSKHFHSTLMGVIPIPTKRGGSDEKRQQEKRQEQQEKAEAAAVAKEEKQTMKDVAEEQDDIAKEFAKITLRLQSKKK